MYLFNHFFLRGEIGRWHLFLLLGVLGELEAKGLMDAMTVAWFLPIFALGDLLVLLGRAVVLGESVDEVAGAGEQCK